MERRLSNKTGEVKWVLITALLTAVLSVVLLRTFIFEGYDFLSAGVASDMIRANLPTYYQMYDSIVSGGNFWSWRMGIGTSMFSHADAAFDPFTYILFLGGRDNIQHMFIWYQIVKLLTEALACYFYLKYFKLDRPVCALGAALYAVSGFSIVMGKNFVLGTICVFCPLYLLGIERFLQERKSKFLFISLVATCLYSYYFFYISGILCAIYLVIRFLMLEGWKPAKLILQLLKLALMGILSVGISAFILLPQIQLTTGSARTNAGKDTAFTADMLFLEWEKLATTVARSFNLNLFGNSVSTSYYGAEYDYFQFTPYVTAAWIPLCGQYLASCSWKKRGYFSVAAALCLYASSTAIFAFVTNAFSTVNYRWMFILNVLLALSCMLGVQAAVRNRGFYRKSLYISIVFALLVYSTATNYMYEIRGVDWSGYKVANLAVYAVMLGLITIDFVILIGQKCKNRPVREICARLAPVLAVFMLFSEAVLNYRGWYCTEPRVNGVLNTQLLYFDSSYDVVKRIQAEDSDFYRINKDFDSVVVSEVVSDNDAMVQGYNGLKSYNSLNNVEYTNFLVSNDVYVAFPPNAIYYATVGLQPKDVTGADLNYINGVYDRYNLMSYLGVKYYITRTPELVLPEQFLLLYQEQDCYVYYNTEYLPLAFTRSQLVSESAFESMTTTEKESVLLNAVVTESIDTAAYSVLGTNYELANLHQNAFELTHFDEDIVGFNIEVDDDAKYIVTSIPYAEDWLCYIDGIRQETEKVNNGMIGIALENHQTGRTLSVRLKYRPKAFFFGCMISVATFAAIVGYVIWTRWKRTHQTAGRKAHKFLR